MAACTDAFDTAVFCDNCLKYFRADATNRAPVSRDVSSESTRRLPSLHVQQCTSSSKFIHHSMYCYFRRYIVNNETVFLNLFTISLVVGFRGNETPKFPTKYFVWFLRHPPVQTVLIIHEQKNVRCTVLHTSVTDLRLKWTKTSDDATNSTRSDRTGGVLVMQRSFELPCVRFRFSTGHLAQGSMYEVKTFFSYIVSHFTDRFQIPYD